MKYLPFERITYRTDLSEQEVMARLSGFVEPKKYGFGNIHTKEYEGSVGDKHFEINRIIKGRNSFIPQINGNIQKSNGETQINITMKLHWIVFAFLIFWCGFIIYSLITTLTIEDLKSLDFFLPTFMILFVYAITMYGFKSESKKSMEYLEKNFEAKKIVNKY
ncbi:hypothetical protein C1637_23620 [Chryseobacterium lactis]|uniref:Uncharacterized protein n=1 Tax=Chryseobacterium lactis TaxID=1241981 RepID=A0A3G6REF0_CHRLC|nr:hypothetical protein [Chryseobacterium lactis]AZA82823.1 hypothetical protein EG342_13485 [Chryseobacterium lactis]AZB03205.1 hypothetical protein EG341_04350 [Chryseobacterium lactis]PNW11274.1 hypothetical protein C1637_23620 [Chryseobacterium lactis]